MTEHSAENGCGGLAVIHVALGPGTGVWSVIRDLSLAQAGSGRYKAVAIGVIAPPSWPDMYTKELARLGLPHFLSKTLDVFGTAQFLWQRVRRPPLGAWVRQLLDAYHAGSAIVHFHNAWMSGVFLPINVTGDGCVKPVATFHGVTPLLLRRPVRRWAHRYMAQRLKRYGAKLTTVAAESLPLAEKLFGLAPSSFAVIPNGLPATRSLRADRWDGTGAFTVGYVGSLDAFKGWRIVVEGVLKLRATGRQIRLVIAGTGQEEASARAKAMEHPETIAYAGYVVSPRENLMPRLHVLSLLSEFEGLPMVLIEAASIGLPAVATAVGAIPEIVADGLSGLLIPRSAERFAEALAKLYDDPGLLDRMGCAARNRHAEHFEIGKVVRLYHEVYTAA